MEDRFIGSARALGAAALVALAAWLAMVVFVAPIEKVQGVVQKIFYAHVPCWPATYLGFVLTAIGGIGFLQTRRESWDRLAFAGAQVGVLFGTLGLLTGPLWAKPVWNAWWVWDLRLTTTLVLWFLYVAYLFLRAFAYGSDTARTFAAVYGILGTALIPLVYKAVDIASGLHPSNPLREGMPAGMLGTLWVGVGAYLLVFAYFLARRMEIGQLEAARDESSWAS